MTETLLHTSEDFQWLADTHLKAFASMFTGVNTSGRPHLPFVLAIVHGNEDCPDTIDLFSEDHFQAPYLRFVQSANTGEFYLQGVRHA